MLNFRKFLVLLGSWIFVFLIGLGGTFGNYNQFVEKIDQLDFSVERYQNIKAISRYDFAKALNLIYCNDCMIPKLEQVHEYNSSWWSNFKQKETNYFDDIGYQGGVYRGDSYYYCVAHSGKKGYMSGYPNSSGFCEGRFCGYNNTSYAELIQSLYNIIAQNQYSQYEVDRYKLRSRFVNLNKGSYEYVSLTDKDIKNIQKGVQNCNNSDCFMSTASQMDTYMHFCTYNPKECNFQEFENIPSGTWPLGQANILLQEDIMTKSEIENMNLYGTISGEEVLRYIYKMSNIVSCSFDLDYSNDGVLNTEDNCPYDYNPTQSDIDNDGKGNVCTDNIRGDGLHPVGIVDDQCNLIPSKINDVGLNINSQGPYNVGEQTVLCPKVQGGNSYGIEYLGWKVLDSQGQEIINTSGRGLEECINVSFDSVDEYSVYLRGYNEYDTKVTSSQKTIIPDGNLQANLEPESISPKVGEAIQINTNYEGFDRSDIDYIKWKFDDLELYGQLNRSYQCRNVGTVNISQEIKLNNGTDLYGDITVVCQPEDNESMISGPGCYEDDIQQARAMYIYGNPLSSNAPQEVQFDSEIIGDCEEIKWDFGDGSKGRGKTPSHYYERAGNYNVLAQCIDDRGKAIIGGLTLKLNENTQSQVGMNMICNPLVGNSPHRSSCKIDYEGDIDYVEWTTDGTSKQLDSNDQFGYVFDDSGQYDIVARGYDSNDNLISQSISNIQVDSEDVIYSKQYGTDLYVDKLNLEVGELVEFETNIQGFEQEKIANILWDFGDGQEINNNDLSTTKVYHEKGPVLVRQNIQLENGITLSNELTLYIVDEQNNAGKGSSLLVNPLRQRVGEPVSFRLETKEIKRDKIKEIRWSFGDGKTKSYVGKYIDEGFEQEYIYNRIDNYVAYVDIHTQDRVFKNKATVDIYGPERCSGDDIQRYQCDMDSDGIPDMCSPDISGDGYKNLMGILLYENDDCSITEDNTDTSLLEKQHNLASDQDGGFDNCPFSYNPDQVDVNGDGIGNKCELLKEENNYNVGSKAGIGGVGGVGRGAFNSIDGNKSLGDGNSQDGFNFGELHIGPGR